MRETWISEGLLKASIARELKAGEALFRNGDESRGFYEVLIGRVRLLRTDRTGRESVLHTAEAGDTFAEASLFSSHYHCDAVASTDARVRLYPKRFVLRAFEHEPRLYRSFSAMLARQVMALRTRLEQRNIKSASDRLRHYLSINVGPDGHTIALRGTLKELAVELGLTHEALYRALSSLEKAGEITRHDKIILLSGV